MYLISHFIPLFTESIEQHKEQKVWHDEETITVKRRFLDEESTRQEILRS